MKENRITSAMKLFVIVGLVFGVALNSPDAEARKRKIKKSESNTEEVMYDDDASSDRSDSLSSYDTFSLELLGAGILYSIDYSHRFNKNMVLNLGFSYYGASSSSGGVSASTSVFLLPVYFSYLLGGDNHFFEPLAGIDVAIASGSVSSGAISGTSSGFGAIPMLGIGYRYWPMDGGFYFRASLYAFIASGGVGIWPGFTFGYAF